MKVKDLGQVFTPDFIVDKLLSLRKNYGKCMEPSCGAGAISSRIDNVFALFVLNMVNSGKLPMSICAEKNVQNVINQNLKMK